MANKSSKQKGEINLKTSINTDSVNQNIYTFGDTEAPHITNTGIEREGGITNIYEQEITLPTGSNIVTEDGKNLNFNSGVVAIDGKTIANVSPYGIEKDLKLAGYDDVVLTATGTVMGVVISPTNLKIDEYSLDNVLLNTRTTAFSSLATAYPFYTTLSFVRYEGIKFADSLEFNLRLGDATIIMKESTPTQSLEASLLSSSVLGTNAVKAVCIYGNYLCVAGVGGRIGSFDGNNWKNYDGSGIGVGPFDNGTVIGTNDINCLVSYQGSLVVGGVGGRIGSWDGFSWRAYNSAGVGLWNNATVISTDNVTAMYIHGLNIIVGGHLGKLGSWSGTAWILYSDATVGALCDNATLIGAVSINAMTVYNPTTDVANYVLVVAGAGGKVGSLKFTGGATLTQYSTGYVASPFELTTPMRNIAYGNGIFISICYLTNICLTSPDGINWTQHATVPSSIICSSITFANGIFIIVPLASGNFIYTTSDGINFIQQTLPSTQQWGSSTYGGGVFTILPDTGTSACYSYNGIDWIASTLPTNQNWASVAYGNGTFVAVANTSISATSPDGITWTARTISATTDWISVTYGNGIFVAVSSVSGTIASSSIDGITWNARTLPSVANWYSVAYGNGIFLAVGSTTFAATSIDGITWTARTKPSVTFCLSSAYGNGMFVVMKMSTTVSILSVSTLWTKRVSTDALLPDYPTNNATAIGANAINAMAVYNNSLVVAGVGGRVASFNGNTWINYNISGLSWKQNSNIILPSAPGGANGWAHVTYGNGLFVAVALIDSTTSGIATSPDGITWTFQTTTAPGGIWRSVGYGNGLFVAVAQTTSTTSGIATSPDGITWTFQTTTAPGGLGWISVTYGNGLFVALSITNSTTAGIATSPDGINWTFQTTTAPTGVNGWRYVTYGNGLFVVVADSTSTTSGIATSPDGITWTFQTTTAPGGTWISVGYGNGLFIALANTTSTTAGIATSPDGIIWTFRTTTAPGGNWRFVTYGNGLYVATTQSNSTTAGIAISEDGINWIFQTTLIFSGPGAFLKAWTSVAYGNGLFVITASTNSISGSMFQVSRAYTDNATVIGANDISSLNVYSTYLAVAGVGGRIGSFNIDGSKNLYTGATGIRNNATAIGANNINALLNYGTKMMVGGATSTVGSMNADLTFNQFWTEGGTTLANLLAGFNNFNYLYTYRYENGKYLINLVGNSNNVSYSIDNTAKTYVTLKARYAIPQVSNGKTRHILTGDPVYTAAKIESIGLHGYTNFITYSDVEVFPTAAFASITSVPSKNVGFGAVDHTYTIGTGTYNWCPQYKADMGSLYQSIQSNTDTLINAYGKLTNNYKLTPSKPFEFRVNWIAGIQSYLSVARLSGATDNLGTIITNVGEFDDTYTPHIVTDDTILYKYNNIFFAKKIGTNVTNRLSHIDQYIYKINTISPVNIVNTFNSTMAIGSGDYNGRVLFSNVVTSSVTATAVNTLYKRKFSNSIDPGDKLVYITTPTSANMQAIGYNIADTGQISDKFVLDTYIADVYSYSTFADGSEYVNPVKSNTLYLQDSIIPVAIGANYEPKIAKTNVKTLLLNPVFDGYLIGNEINGLYILFDLFGQQYAFDNKNIYMVSMNGAAYAGLVKVCDAFGMSYIASSPTIIFFYSDFDNSIYTFDGGRSVTKFKRLSSLDTFIKGIYSTKDNSLLFETTSTFVWLRDNVFTQNSKKASQTNLKLYNTTDGIVIGNDSNTWRYNWADGSGYTLVPLVFQSAFLGLNLNEKGILSEYVYSIYSENKEKMSIIGKICTIDESDNYSEQDMRWDIDAPDYSSNGYCRLRAKPAIYRPLATSLQLEFNNKTVLYDLTAQFTDSSDAVVSAKKTR